MAIIHVPRTIVSICRGLLRGRRNQQPQQQILKDGVTKIHSNKEGFHPDTPSIYKARAGLFDVDYLGHMNNAAFLNHAEYARWEMVASNGLLSKMFQHNTHFMVAGTTIRYRRQIRPIFRKFLIESYVAGLDARNIWILQQFRCLSRSDSNKTRIRAQMVVQGVTVLNGRHVVDPRTFFAEQGGIDPELVHSLDLQSPTHPTPSLIAEELMNKYNSLDDVLRQAASMDDELHDSHDDDD